MQTRSSQRNAKTVTTSNSKDRKTKARSAKAGKTKAGKAKANKKPDLTVQIPSSATPSYSPTSPVVSANSPSYRTTSPFESPTSQATSPSFGSYSEWRPASPMAEASSGLPVFNTLLHENEATVGITNTAPTADCFLFRIPRTNGIMYWAKGRHMHPLRIYENGLFLDQDGCFRRIRDGVITRHHNYYALDIPGKYRCAFFKDFDGQRRYLKDFTLVPPDDTLAYRWGLDYE